MVRKTAEHFRKMGQPIPLQEMISLYDTHGIQPEIARESAQEMGASVELPDTFYSLVAKTHIKAEAAEAPKLVIPGKTELLFYEHPFDQTFEAQVIDVMDGDSVILDRTMLYPEGGGQPADHGTLEKGGQDFRVKDVQKVGDVVLHKLEKPEGLQKGDLVKGRVDMRRRLAHARHSPPTGMTVFVIQAQNPDIPVARIYRGTLPFLAADFVLVGLLIAWPGLVSWLPAALKM